MFRSIKKCDNHFIGLLLLGVAMVMCSSCYPVSPIINQVGTHVFVKVSSCAISKGELRIVLEKNVYKHEKSVGAVLTGEPAPEIPIIKDFIELKYDVDHQQDVNKMDLEGKVIISFTNIKSDIVVRAVPDSDFVGYWSFENMKNQYNIYDTKEQEVAAKLPSEGPFWGQTSPDFSIFYYFHNGRVYRYDIAPGAGKVLPGKAYRFLKENVEEVGLSSIADVIFLREDRKDNYILYNLMTDKVIGRFTIPEFDTVYDVAIFDDQLIILGEYEYGRVLRKVSGEVVAMLELSKEKMSLSHWAWDKENSKIYFVDYSNDENSRVATGLLKILVWDYQNGETSRVILQFDGKNALFKTKSGTAPYS